MPDGGPGAGPSPKAGEFSDLPPPFTSAVHGTPGNSGNLASNHNSGYADNINTGSSVGSSINGSNTGASSGGATNGNSNLGSNAGGSSGSATAGGSSSVQVAANGVASSAHLLADPKLREVLLSDVGVEALLLRLKQSIHTSKEMAAYIKKMATLEAEHSAHLKKLSRTTSELLKRPEVKKGTCQTQIVNMMKSTDRYGDAGVTFIDTMHKIHDELLEVVRSMDRQRKTLKEAALRNEKNLVDAEREVEKAKSKYDTACEELEKARTADPNKSKLGFKSKSEEELHRRMTISETDYQQKVDTAQRLRGDLVTKLRVESVRRLQGLILETDNALSLQLVRFANLFETLQLNRGFVIAPIRTQGSSVSTLAIKDMAGRIDSELDFYNFVCAVPKTKPVLNRAPAVFKKHPTLGSAPPTTSSSSYKSYNQGYGNNNYGGGSSSGTSYGGSSSNYGGGGTSSMTSNTNSSSYGGNYSGSYGTPKSSYVDSFQNDPFGGMSKQRDRKVSDRKVSGDRQASSGSIPTPSVMISSGTAKTGPVLSKHGPNSPQYSDRHSEKYADRHSGKMSSPQSPPAATGVAQSVALGRPVMSASTGRDSPSLDSHGFGGNLSESAGSGVGSGVGSAPPSGGSGVSVTPTIDHGSSAAPAANTALVGTTAAATSKSVYDPSKHGLAVYGTPLEDLLEYEEGTVPRIVYQCVQAIDNFGLEVEGIYRTNGNKDQVAEIRHEFDIDAAAVDLLRPTGGVNDIHSVASALKQYFQALPDPLLTREFHAEFLQAAGIAEDVRRRDSLHAIINNLPDPNYTTLRYLVFHLYRVQDRADVNKMDVTNLGIIWGPILMKAEQQNVGEMAAESRALQTILVNAYAIFEAE